MQFITLRPKIVLIDLEGNPHVIRDNEDMESIVSHEKVPEHLQNFNL